MTENWLKMNENDRQPEEQSLEINKSLYKMKQLGIEAHNLCKEPTYIFLNGKCSALLRYSIAKNNCMIVPPIVHPFQYVKNLSCLHDGKDNTSSDSEKFSPGDGCDLSAISMLTHSNATQSDSGENSFSSGFSARTAEDTSSTFEELLMINNSSGSVNSRLDDGSGASAASGDPNAIFQIYDNNDIHSSDENRI